MEDILASIRRIIADDQLQAGRSGLGSVKRSSQPALPAATEASPQDHKEDPADHSVRHDAYEEVLDLARMPEAVVQEPTLPVAESYRVTTPRPDVYGEDAEAVVSDHGAIDSYVNGYASPAPSERAAVADLTPPVAEQVAAAQAYTAPAQQVAPQQLRTSPQNADSLLSPALGASVMSSFETLAASVVLQNNGMIERVMHDAMRPLIKTWLEENLPTMVERLVRAEIERVARGGRG